MNPTSRFRCPRLGVVLVCVALIVALVLAGGCKAKPTTKTPSGTLRLLLQATKARDVAKMQSYCTGQAATACQGLLDAIAEMETTGKASKFEYWNPSVGPQPTGPRADAFADLMGVSKDIFMRVSVTLVRDPEKPDRWKIDQMTWESRRKD